VPNRIKAEFKSYAGVEYTVYIVDSDFVESSTFPRVIGDDDTGNVWGDESIGEVWGWNALDDDEAGGLQTQPIAPPGLRLDYETQNENPWSAVMIPSRLTFTLFFQNDVQETFLTDLASSGEGEFLVYVEKNGSLWWTGVLTPDVIEFEDQWYPYAFQFVAQDGLARLKSIDYSDNGEPYRAKATLYDVIYTCLGELETNGIWQNKEAYFAHNVKWRESNQTYTPGYDVLANTRLNQDVLFRQEEKDDGDIEYKFFDCFEVIEEIATIFNARFFQSEGTWRFIQRDQYDSSLQNLLVYDKVKQTVSTTVQNNLDKDVDQVTRARAEGKWGYLPALKEVSMLYNHRGAFNLLSLVDEWFAEEPPENTPGAQNQVLGPILANEGLTKIYAKINLSHDTQFPIPPFVPVRHQYRFKVKVGNYYLRRTATFNSFTNIVYGDFEWTTSTAYVEIWTDPFPNVQTLEFTSPTVPQSGTLEVDFYREVSRDEDGAIFNPNTSNNNPNYNLTWNTYNSEVKLIYEGTVFNEENKRLYKATNDLANNTYQVELETVIGDGPNEAALGHLETFDGSDWQISTGWDIGNTGTDLKIQELVLREILAMQSTPTLKFMGRILDVGTADIAFQHRIKIDDKYYIFLGASFLANQDEWMGEWFYVDRKSSNVSLEDDVAPIEGDPIQFPITVSPPVVDPPGVIFDDITPGETEALFSGYASNITLAQPIGDTLLPGDQITVLNTTNGATQTFEVAGYVSATDTVVPIDDEVAYDFPSGSPYIVTQSNLTPNTTQQVMNAGFTIETGDIDDTTPVEATVEQIDTGENVGNGSTAGLLMTDAKIELYNASFADPVWKLDLTNGKVIPTNFYPVQILEEIPKGTGVTAAPLDEFYIVPSDYNGYQITKIGLGLSATASGSGSSTLLLEKNGTTAATIDFTNQATRLAEYTFTAVSIATNDLISFNVSAVESPAPEGMIIYLYIQES